MKTIVLLITLIVLVASNCCAIDADKKGHYGLSVPFGILGGAIIEDCCSEWPWYYKIPAATAIGMIPGLGKEFIDEVSGSGWDNKDLLADALGSATGVGIVFVYKW